MANLLAKEHTHSTCRSLDTLRRVSEPPITLWVPYDFGQCPDGFGLQFPQVGMRSPVWRADTAENATI